MEKRKETDAYLSLFFVTRRGRRTRRRQSVDHSLHSFQWWCRRLLHLKWRMNQWSIVMLFYMFVLLLFRNIHLTYSLSRDARLFSSDRISLLESDSDDITRSSLFIVFVRKQWMISTIDALVLSKIRPRVRSKCFPSQYLFERSLIGFEYQLELVSAEYLRMALIDKAPVLPWTWSLWRSCGKTQHEEFFWVIFTSNALGIYRERWIRWSTTCLMKIRTIFHLEKWVVEVNRFVNCEK